MSGGRRVRIYLDFISPYTWLALRRLGGPEWGDVEWTVHPVVYAALLTSHGLVGPVETEAKRRYTFRDVARNAARMGIEVVGPPEHPFRSLEALRVLCLHRDSPAAFDLAVALSDAAWGKGRSLTDPAVLEDVVRSAGLDPGGLAERLADPAVKGALRDLTAEAEARGVFGVPTFEYEGELFWGHDRLDHLADHMAGRLPDSSTAAEALIARPRGVERRG